MLRLRGGWLVAVSWFGVLAVDGGSASACPARCLPLRLFQEGSSIPGDRFYFKLLLDDPGPVSLKTEAGKDIAASIRMIGPDRVFAPLEPIAAGTAVVLTYSLGPCAGRDPISMSSRYRSREPLAVQLQEAHLTPGPYGLVQGLPEFASVMAGPLAFQELSYGSLDAAGALLHLVDIDVNVDGRPYLSQWGVAWDSSFDLHAVCTGSDPVPQPVGTCSQRLLGRGRHVITAQPHIVGQVDPPAATLEIDFDVACNIGRAATSGATHDAGTAPSAASAAGTSSALPVDAGVSHAAVAAGRSASTPERALAGSSSSAPPSPASGCSTSGGGASDGALGFVLFALACWRRRKLNQA